MIRTCQICMEPFCFIFLTVWWVYLNSLRIFMFTFPLLLGYEFISVVDDCDSAESPPAPPWDDDVGYGGGHCIKHQASREQIKKTGSCCIFFYDRMLWSNSVIMISTLEEWVANSLPPPSTEWSATVSVAWIPAQLPVLSMCCLRLIAKKPPAESTRHPRVRTHKFMITIII